MGTTIKALVFDIYGTLFDVHTVSKKAEELYPGKGTEISNVWRQKQLEYSFLRTLMGNYETFMKITRDSLRYALKQNELPLDEEKEEALIEAYKELTYYPEVPAILEEFQDKQLAVFSNGSRDMLLPLLYHANLISYFDEIITVDDIKQYKPSPASYMHALKVLGIKREEVLFMSSNGWDISGAKNFGFHTAWINRKNAPVEELQLEPDAIYEDLTGLREWK